MQVNFEFLKERVVDSLNNTDLDYIRNELKRIDKATAFSGVGGSSVVSEFGSKVVNKKNGIITINSEPRDFIYRSNAFDNVVACSYSGNNYGVDVSFQGSMKKYLLSNNSFDDKDVTYLKYDTTIDKERSFISLGATLVPVSILMDYYLDGKTLKRCHQNCLRCSNAKNDNCIKCQSNYYLTEDTQSCYSKEINNYYLDGNTLKKCHPNCLKCINNQNSECILCQSNYFMTEDTNSCYNETIDNYYIDNNILRKCHPNCLRCSDSDNINCISCQKIFLFD